MSVPKIPKSRFFLIEWVDRPKFQYGFDMLTLDSVLFSENIDIFRGLRNITGETPQTCKGCFSGKNQFVSLP